MTESEWKRFNAKVRISESGCHEWTANLDKTGYGRFWLNGKLHLAHRVSYENTVGAVPEGLFLDHKCRNRSCVNPEHLHVVTARENILLGEGPTAINATKTHCSMGHPFNTTNTIWKGTQRYCRTCKNETMRHLRMRTKGWLALVIGALLDECGGELSISTASLEDIQTPFSLKAVKDGNILRITKEN